MNILRQQKRPANHLNYLTRLHYTHFLIPSFSYAITQSMRIQNILNDPMYFM